MGGYDGHFVHLAFSLQASNCCAMSKIQSIVLTDEIKRAGHEPVAFVCSALPDHDCEGPDAVHIGMVLTLQHGAHKAAFRIVWMSPSKKHVVAMPLDMLYDSFDRGRFEGRFRTRLGVCLRVGKDGRWWEEGGTYANKQPAQMGYGELNMSPEV